MRSVSVAHIISFLWWIGWLQLQDKASAALRTALYLPHFGDPCHSHLPDSQLGDLSVKVLAGAPRSSGVSPLASLTQQLPCHSSTAEDPRGGRVEHVPRLDVGGIAQPEGLACPSQV